MDAKHDCCGRDNGFQSHAGGCPVQTEYERHYRDRAEAAESKVSSLTASLASVTAERDHWMNLECSEAVPCPHIATLAELRKRMGNARKLEDDDVKWVVNDLAEIGVEVNDQVFFLYKGESYRGGERYRRVFKREFGECQHPHDWPPNGSGNTYVGYRGEDESEWASIRRLASPPLPAPVESKHEHVYTSSYSGCVECGMQRPAADTAKPSPDKEAA